MNSFFRKIWRGWKAAGRKAGDLQIKFLLNLFFFLVLPPFVLVYRLSQIGISKPSESSQVKGDPLPLARIQY